MKEILLLEDCQDLATDKINRYFYQAYLKARREGLERLDFEETGWAGDYPEIIENLERFGIEEFTFSSQSTSLMESLQAFKARGYQPIDLIEIKEGQPALLLKKMN